MNLPASPDRRWWKEAVVYQVYPRSFQDADGDGIGDLRGVTHRLDYLKTLGVDVIWLSPVYASPNDDNGYDISDYYAIHPEFGTMADFDELVAEGERRGIGILMDLVVNHCSDEHAWFQDARRSADSPYRDYFIWREGRAGGPPNNWQSLFGGSAWERTPETDAYYLHLFSRKQVDLNWEHAPLREEVYRMMRYWLDKGIAGFRMDVIPFISKPDGLPDRPDSDREGWLRWYANGPRVHDYLQEMHREVMAHYDCFTVGEAPGVSTEEARLYVDADRRELDMIFQFYHFEIDRQPGAMYDVKAWTLQDFKEGFGAWDRALAEGGWNSLFLGNHDLPRMVSRFGDDRPAFRAPSAKMLATLLFTLRGTPYVYNGDEIGMTNVPFESLDDYRDISAVNYVAAQRAAGRTDAELLPILHRFSRDNARTPVQWDDAPHAGFSLADAPAPPWLPVNPNYPQVNAVNDLKDPEGIFHYYRHAIALRKAYPTLVYGDYEVIDEPHPHVYAYLRTNGAERFLVVLNFTAEAVDFALPGPVADATRTLVLRNYAVPPETGATLALQPYEARVYALK
ncbi:MAG: alpha-glucosidase [Catalinimonas sp.]